jgi:hypothetical protein
MRVQGVFRSIGLAAGVAVLVTATTASAEVGPRAVPPNDEAVNATVIPGLPLSEVQSTVEATIEGSWETNPWVTGIDATVWYQHTPPVGGRITVDLCNSDFDTKLGVWDTIGVPTGLITFSDDACGLGSRVVFDADAGTTYWFQMGGHGGATGTLDIEVTFEEAPPHDDIAEARLVDGFIFVDVLSTEYATVEGSWETDGFAMGHTVWYTYTATDDLSLTVSLCGSDFDTRLAVWHDDGGMNRIASADDTCGLQSEIIVDVTRDETYWFQFGGYEAEFGSLDVLMTPNCNGLPATLVGDETSEGLAGGPGVDVIHGMGGADWLYGRGGDDVICGGRGADRISGGPGSDWIDGGAGQNDWVSYLEAGGGVTVDLRTGVSTGSHGDDTLANVEHIRGSRFDDLLIGNPRANRIFGYQGADEIDGKAGDDVIDGGAGQDLIRGGTGTNQVIGGLGKDTGDYSSAQTPVRVDLAQAWAIDEAAITTFDQLSEVENVRGSKYDDGITGDANANVLRGLGGGDSLWGEGGDDVLVGGAGYDFGFGGAGNDRCFTEEKTGC